MMQPRPQVLIAGDGIAAAAVSDLLPQAEMPGPFTESELPGLMARISVMYALYPPERGNILQGALPAKMFEAAAFGRPTVVNSGCHMGEVCESEQLGRAVPWGDAQARSEEHTSELQSRRNLVCRLLLEQKKSHRLHWNSTTSYTSHGE